MDMTQDDDDLFELRIFVEEIVGDLCRFMHVVRDGVDPDSVRIRQEVQVGLPGAFADIVVEVPNLGRYIVEADYGYPAARIVQALERKYHRDFEWFGTVSKLVLVVDQKNHPDLRPLHDQVRRVIPAKWELEIWNEDRLFLLMKEFLGVQIDSFKSDKLQDIRAAIDQAKGRYAFGDDYENSPLDASFLWHFSCWRLRKLFDDAGKMKSQLLQPGIYPAVVVLFADMSGYSGFVRDSPNDHTIQQCLSSFCSKSRNQITNDGGMVYQFLGDSVVGFFGFPDLADDYVDRALDCAKSLLMLGESVANEWQRRLDRVQPAHGCHIGIAVGDVQIYSLQPFSRTHFGAVGDAVNMAARLSAHAQSGQIVVSNMVQRRLTAAARNLMQEAAPVQAKNVGLIKAWKYDKETQVGALFD